MGTNLQATLSTGALNGSVTVNPDGSFTYTPNNSNVISDSFEYTIASSTTGGSSTSGGASYSSGSPTSGGTLTATVRITGTAPGTTSSSLIAVDDEITDVTMQEATDGFVLGNDTYSSATVTSYTQGQFGTVTVSPDGRVEYLQTRPFTTDTDYFMYTLTNSTTGQTDTATVTVRPAGTSMQYIDAINDTETLLDNSPVTIDVLLNDIKPLPIDRIELAELPTNGTAIVRGLTILYTPTPGSYSDDSFTYTVFDEDGHSDTATVTLTYSNAEPEFTQSGWTGEVGDEDDTDQYHDFATFGEDFTGTVGYVYAIDPDGDTLTYSIDNPDFTINAFGRISITPGATPDASEVQQTFNVTVSDGRGRKDEARIYVNVVAAKNDVVEIPAALGGVPTPVTFNVLINDIGQADRSVSWYDQPEYGDLVYNGDGSFTYTPWSATYEEDSFTYEMTEGRGGTDLALVTLRADCAYAGSISLNGVTGDPVLTVIHDAGTTVTITGGDMDQLFQVNPTTGVISLRTELLVPRKAPAAADGTPAPPEGTLRPRSSTYTLQVTATLNGRVDNATATITILPVVGLYGDTQVLERTGNNVQDQLMIKFVRKAVDISQPLDVEYEFVFPTNDQVVTPEDHLATPDDLALTGLLTGTSGTVHFDAGSEIGIIGYVTANPDAKEVVETFKVKVKDAGLGAAYAPMSERYFLDELGDDYLHSTASGTVTYSILDGIVLFAGLNDTGHKSDYGVFGESSTDFSNYNDVDQGVRGDCFLLACIAGLARSASQTSLEQIVKQEANGDFTVTLSGWSKTYKPEEVLSLGQNAAALSGDHDANGNSEIWVQLIEKAVVDASLVLDNLGVPAGAWYGRTESAWRLLTGKNATTYLDFGEGETLDSFIQEAQTAGDPVVFSITSPTATPSAAKPTPPSDIRGNRVSLAAPHAYLFLGWGWYNGMKIAKFYNPHGADEVAGGEVWIDAAQITSIVDGKEVIAPWFTIIRLNL